MKICTTTNLLSHQSAAVEKLQHLKVGALFMEMGTGKTRTAIELAKCRGTKISRVIWFTLVSLKETVRCEIKKHTTAIDKEIFLFDNKVDDSSIPWAAWYIVGLESLGSSDRVALAVNKIITHDSLVIVDESSYIKGHNAKRTRRTTSFSERARYRLLLTGTPISQGVQDLYSQMRFLSEKILGYRSWYSFAHNHLEYSDKYIGKIVRAHNTEWLAAKIAPYVYQVTKDECLSLPEKLHEHYHCELTEEQQEAYGQAKDQFFQDVMEMDCGSDLKSSLPIFRLFTALQAIVCGYINRDGNIHVLNHNRMELLQSVLNDIDTNEPVIVWAKYHFCREQIASSIKGRKIFQYHGKINEKKRHHELEKWKHNGGVLLATQDAGGHGLDLTSASHVIFYANGFKYSSRLQAEDRCHRLGQNRPVVYADLWANCGIEDRIYSSLSHKGNVVDDFREEVNAVKEDRGRGLKRLLEKL